jgi:DNA helicase II / ATP-dependent DNA helicase PcrA
MLRTDWIELNAPRASEEQRQVILATDPRIVCVAGPGSGKTSCVTWRIQALVAEGVDPKTIVAITFTNDAAREMESRLNGVKLGFIGTLHSYCLRLLQTAGGELGYPRSIGIVDEEEARRAMDKVLLLHNIKAPVDNLMKLRESEGVQPHPSGRDQIAVAKYARHLKELGVVDFTGILEGAVKVAHRAAPISHLFVDEFQDSAEIDVRIYDALPAENRFFVGDGDQSMYEFRGARVDNILEECNRPGTRVLKLEGNFRCAHEVCVVAQRLIEHNEKRINKATVARSNHDGNVRLAVAQTEADELRQIANQVREWLEAGHPPHEIAVLARTNALVAAISKELRESQIPLRERIQADLQTNALVCSMIELMRNPYSERAAANYIRLIQGEQELKEMRDQCARDRTYLTDMVPTISRASTVWGNDLLSDLAKAGCTPAELAPVARAMASIVEPDLGALVLQLQRHDHHEDGSGVLVTTIHGSKGREFKCVWVAGVEAKTLPSGTNIEEERRMFFVALTRAKQELVVSYSQRRTQKYGRKQAEDRFPSPFIEEALGDLALRNANEVKCYS